MANEQGRAIIALEGAIVSETWESEQERDEFLAHLADSFKKRLHQSVLTWRANKVDAERKAKAKANADIASPKQDDAPVDGLAKHKAEFKAQQEARKSFL